MEINHIFIQQLFSKRLTDPDNATQVDLQAWIDRYENSI